MDDWKLLASVHWSPEVAMYDIRSISSHDCRTREWPSPVKTFFGSSDVTCFKVCFSSLYCLCVCALSPHSMLSLSLYPWSMRSFMERHWLWALPMEHVSGGLAGQTSMTILSGEVPPAGRRISTSMVKATRKRRSQ